MTTMGDGIGWLSGSYLSCLFFNRRLCILCWSTSLSRIGPRGSFCGVLLRLRVVAILVTMRFTSSGAMLSAESWARYPSILACFSGPTAQSLTNRHNAQFSSTPSTILTMLQATPREASDSDSQYVQPTRDTPLVGGTFAAPNYESDENGEHGPRRHVSPSSKRNTTLPVTSIPGNEPFDITTLGPNAERGTPRFNDSFLKSAAGGDGVTKTVNVLESQLEEVQRKVYERNSGVEFNINSHAKLSRVLFGPQGGSTEKAVLEAKAASGDRMADLILQYRSLKQQIARIKRREDNVRNGSLASSPSAVARVNMREDHGADPLMLIDASSYIFRAYYSMPPIHRAIDGMPTGAVLGFCNMLNKLALNKMISGDTPRLVLVFDAKGKTFRHELYNDYKSHRPEAPMDLIPQFALVRQAATAYGLCQIEAPSFEADDVIASLARMAVEEGLDVNIFSGDKDLMQLVSDQGVSPAVQMIDPATMKRYTHEAVVEKWGVPPSQLGDLLALAGDTADNIPGQ
jgi:5'-3' exonuclease, N-terminal resolvase-like domain